jgi:hypothetical protein
MKNIDQKRQALHYNYVKAILFKFRSGSVSMRKTVNFSCHYIAIATHCLHKMTLHESGLHT